MSREPKDLIPEMQELYTLFCEAMEHEGLRFICTCTRRTQAEQDNLFAQGRSKPGRIVTWTRHSLHVEGEAFDIAMLKNGEVTWDAKDYEKAGVVGESVGLTWGGRFSHPDRPHFELKNDV